MALPHTDTINTQLQNTFHSDAHVNDSLILKKMPLRLALFSKALLSKSMSMSNGTHGQSLNGILSDKEAKQAAIPKLSLRLNNIKPVAKKVKRYAKVCGFNLDGQTLPITYPHILAFNLHLKLMTHERFPLPVMGLVHIRNTITARRTILMSELLDLHVFIGESRVTNKGIEFDIHSHVSVKNEKVWESITTNVFIIKRDVNSPPKTPNTFLQHLANKSPLRYHQLWSLPANLGRKYALASGDANPIHLHPQSAKLFGFKHAIAHGMWLKAHTIASLSPIINEQSAMTLSVEFKQPTPLNKNVRMNYQEKTKQVGNHDIDFDIRSTDGRKLHMVGFVEYSSHSISKLA